MSDQIQDKRRSGWFWIDNQIARDIMQASGAKGIAVYACLCLYANSEGKCFPSIPLLADQLHLSEPTVRKALTQLEEAGVISIERNRETDEGAQITNLYTLNDRGGSKIDTPRSKIEPGGGKKGAPGGVKNRPTNNTHKNNTHKNKDSALDSAHTITEPTRLLSATVVIPPSRPSPSEETKPHPRDLIFDAIAEFLFDAPPGDERVKAVSGRVGQVKKWLLDFDPKLSAERIKRFAAWYKAKCRDVSLPRVKDKVLDHYSAWKKEAAASINAPSNLPPGKVLTPDGRIVSPGQLRMEQIIAAEKAASPLKVAANG